MKLKRNGNKIQHGDFETPGITIAEFTDDSLTEKKERFILQHNCGIELFELLQQTDTDRTRKAFEMIEEMSQIYEKYYRAEWIIRHRD